MVLCSDFLNNTRPLSYLHKQKQVISSCVLLAFLEFMNSGKANCIVEITITIAKNITEGDVFLFDLTLKCTNHHL